LELYSCFFEPVNYWLLANKTTKKYKCGWYIPNEVNSKMLSEDGFATVFENKPNVKKVLTYLINLPFLAKFVWMSLVLLPTNTYSF
jgi:hypothetical protein